MRKAYFFVADDGYNVTSLSGIIRVWFFQNQEDAFKKAKLVINNHEITNNLTSSLTIKKFEKVW